MTDRNEGMIVSGGGTVNAGAISVGRGARVEIGVNQSTFPGGALADPEIVQRIDALGQSLRDNAARLADHDSALAQLDALTNELGRPEPRGSRLTAILRTLRDNIGPVSAVLGSVEAIEHSLTLLL
jgi:hypothetical protein